LKVAFRLLATPK